MTASVDFAHLKSVAMRLAGAYEFKSEVDACVEGNVDDEEFLIEFLHGVVLEKMSAIEEQNLIILHQLGIPVPIPKTKPKPLDVNKLLDSDERKSLLRKGVQLEYKCGCCAKYLKMTERVVCEGCKNQVYCSRICQQKMVEKHMESCPKSKYKCVSCKKTLSTKKTRLRCSGCLLAMYCSVECQKIEWHKHKLVCNNPLPN